jgi:hypothetical protein
MKSKTKNKFFKNYKNLNIVTDINREMIIIIDKVGGLIKEKMIIIMIDIDIIKGNQEDREMKKVMKSLKINGAIMIN